MDILLFDQSDEPTVMAQTTQLLFPVEQVRAAVEVKSRLTAEEIRDCGAKRASLGSLVSHATPAREPAFVVLAYEGSRCHVEALSGSQCRHIHGRTEVPKVSDLRR